MPNVNTFVLDGKEISVEDAIARADASSAQASVATLSNEIGQIKALSRLTVSYSETTATITFTTNNAHE